MTVKEITKTIRECDRLKCRRRQGVVTVRAEISRPDTDVSPTRWEGDLCPYHQKQLTARVEAMFEDIPADVAPASAPAV